MPWPKTLGMPAAFAMHLVVVHRVEVAGRARVAHQIGAGQLVRALGRRAADGGILGVQHVILHAGSRAVHTCEPHRTGPAVAT